MSLQVIELSDSESECNVELTIELSDEERPDTPDLPSPSRLLATMSKAEALSIPSSPPFDLGTEERIERLLRRADALKTRGEAISVSSLADSLPSSEPPLWREQRGLGSDRHGAREAGSLDSSSSELYEHAAIREPEGLGSGELYGHAAIREPEGLGSGEIHQHSGISEPESQLEAGAKKGHTAREISQVNRKKVEPEEVLRDMTLVADKGVQQLFKAGVFEKLQGQAAVRQEEGTGCGIWWEMKVRRSWDAEQKMYVPLAQPETQRVRSTAMVVMKSERLVQLAGDLGRLKRLLEIWRASLKTARLLVCVLGLQKAVKKSAMQATQEFARQMRAYIREGRQRERQEPRGDLEAAVLRMQVTCPWAGWVDCGDSEQALGQLLWQTTLDVGMAGHAQESGSDIAALQVRSGTDLTDTWIRMLAQIPKVTPRVAQTIVCHYPTPCKLFAAWSQQTLEDQKLLLSKIPIPGSTRKLGAFLSARIHHILTERDPHKPH
ncbi:hypothetical protein BX667DRAFT_363286 [Coemansia mojavensis]|nr:hypothetical protein BX667DRAFT_363286 [Coemansia mojavensis]